MGWYAYHSLSVLDTWNLELHVGHIMAKNQSQSEHVGHMELQ
jgi:hypothetical protein